MDNEKVFIELPSEAEVQAEIQTIMKRGMRKHKLQKKKIIKRNTVLAASIMGLLLLLGFAFPDYIRNLPFFSQIFEIYDDRTIDFSHFEEFGENVGIAGEVYIREIRGFSSPRFSDIGYVTLTIEQAFFDGRSLHLMYTVETEEELPEYVLELPHLFFYEQGMHITSGDVWHNTGFSGGGPELERMADNFYRGIWSMSFSNLPTGLTDVTFDFNFGGLDVVFTPNPISTDVLVINQTVQYEDFTTTITDMNISPLSMTLSYEFTRPLEYGYFNPEFFMYSPTPYGRQADLQIRILDDLDNEVHWLETRSSSDERGHGTISILNTNIHPNATEIRIIPFMIIMDVDLGEWRASSPYGINNDVILQNGGSFQLSEVILGEIVIDLP